ncbi:hypothetical protein PATSB16_08100 [Pandoraea thiooxydans]|nr:hypothetical protein PATSB16_08100 [Pandoraea thiooxydans]
MRDTIFSYKKLQNDFDRSAPRPEIAGAHGARPVTSAARSSNNFLIPTRCR